MNNKTLVIMAHTNPADSKINNRIKETLENDENIIYKDIKSLYGDYKFDIQKEQEDLENVDKIVFQFPLYWYTAPSILKQWVDDVFAYDFAFTYKEDGSWEALKLVDKKFQMIVSVGGGKQDYEDMDIKVLDGLQSYSTTASVLGMKEEKPYLIYGVDTHKYTDEQLDEIVLDIKNNILG